MNVVVAAVDQNPATKNVLAAAAAMADLVDGTVVPVHVLEDTHGHSLRRTQDLVGGAVEKLHGDVGQALVDYSRRDDVVAIAIGTRALPTSASPAGHVALYVATNATKPVIVTPPHAHVAPVFKHVLVPVEARECAATEHAPLLQLAADRGVEVTVAHVMTPDDLPAFANHPVYEAEAWRDEFFARYAPSAPERAQFEVRIGSPAELVAQVADAEGIDLVALAWSQDLSPDHAAIVRRLIASCRHPLLLFPVGTIEAGTAGEAPAGGRAEVRAP